MYSGTLDEDDDASPFGDDLLARSRAGGLGYDPEEGWKLGRQDKVSVKEKEGMTGVLFKHHSFLIATEASTLRVGAASES